MVRDVNFMKYGHEMIWASHHLTVWNIIPRTWWSPWLQSWYTKIVSTTTDLLIPKEELSQPDGWKLRKFAELTKNWGVLM